MKGCFAGDSEILSVVDDAKYYLDKAIELDQNNPAAHLGQAMLNEYAKWDYIGTEKELFEGLEISPNNPDIVEYLSEFLEKRNRPEEALSNLKNAETPLWTQTTVQVISGVLSGNKAEATNSVNIFLSSQEDFVKTYAGEYYIWLEEYEAAKESFETALLTKDRYIMLPKFQANLALAYHKTNNYQKAQMIINRLIDKSKKTSAGSPEYFIGWYYSGIGKVDSAFYWLEDACKKHSPEMAWLKVDPAFKSIRTDSRYQDMYERTGHKDYDDYYASQKKN